MALKSLFDLNKFRLYLKSLRGLCRWRYVSKPRSKFFSQYQQSQKRKKYSEIFRYHWSVSLYGWFCQMDEINQMVAAYATPQQISNSPTKNGFIADVVENVAPAVVHIKVKDPKKPVKYSGICSGSGFIISSNGVILTNAHVVMNKPQSVIEVSLQDGQIFEATIEDVDELIDIACLQVKAENLPTVKLGKSSTLKSGEWVVALGNPFGLTHTVTYGVVSTTNRGSEELQLFGKRMEYIQTDAAINEGNSGGPLVNLEGEVIGINVMKLLPGISFSIPIDTAQEFMNASIVKRSGSNRKDISSIRRFVGFSMITLTEPVLQELQRREYKIPPDISFGILIRKIVGGSPASR